MKQSVILISACVAVLAGAWFASRALTTDLPPPPAPPLNEPVAMKALPVLQAPPPQQARPKLDPQFLGQQMKNPEYREPVPAQPAQKPVGIIEPVDEAENPFVGEESRELDYADRLMWETDGGLDRVASARDVYKRCLEAAPDLQRCKDGLAAAEARINVPRVVETPPPTQPTLDPSQTRPDLPLARPRVMKR